MTTIDLRLVIRTPRGVLVDRPVQSVTAEDLDGWFGIRPGRTDLIAALAPGLLIYRDAEGECFAALAGGLLDLRDGECRVMAREAVVARELDALAPALEASLEKRDRATVARADTMEALAKEALRRLVKEQRT